MNANNCINQCQSQQSDIERRDRKYVRMGVEDASMLSVTCCLRSKPRSLKQTMISQIEQRGNCRQRCQSLRLCDGQVR
jgi:hypothetical protein